MVYVSLRKSMIPTVVYVSVCDPIFGMIKFHSISYDNWWAFCLMVHNRAERQHIQPQTIENMKICNIIFLASSKTGLCVCVRVCNFVQANH